MTLAERRPSAPARTPNEALLAAIWAQVLGVREVGIDDNFFSPGGDSMRSLQVRYRRAARGSARS